MTEKVANTEQPGLLKANGWTGAQYSLFRVIFGLYLLVHFVHLIPWAKETFSNQGALADGTLSPLLKLFPNVLIINDSPGMVVAMLVIAAVSAVLFIVGKFDRVAAIVMWYVLACLFGRNPLTANPSLPFVGWMLLAHLFIPSAPFGSLAAKGRVDPRGGWYFPPAIFAAAWALMAIAYSYSGYTKLVSPSWVDGTAMQRVLENPLARPTFLRELMLSLPDFLLKLATWGALALELLFVPLALFRFSRKWIWLVMLLMHFGLLVLIDFADLTLGMVMVHLFTFNPAWIKPRSVTREDHLFFDGHCGLCQRWVRFVLAEDPTGNTFTFAPLQGERITELLNEKDRNSLPDSIVIVTKEKHVLTKSDAALHIAACLGGTWRVLGVAGRIVPRPIRNFGYDCIARMRHKLFTKPKEACPMLPPELRERFVF